MGLGIIIYVKKVLSCVKMGIVIFKKNDSSGGDVRFLVETFLLVP